MSACCTPHNATLPAPAACTVFPSARAVPYPWPTLTSTGRNRPGGASQPVVGLTCARAGKPQPITAAARMAQHPMRTLRLPG